MAELYEYAMLPEHMNSPDPTVGSNSITETGALCISSGSKTGRVPKQKRIVEDDITRDVSTIKLRRRLEGKEASEEGDAGLLCLIISPIQHPNMITLES